MIFVILSNQKKTNLLTRKQGLLIHTFIKVYWVVVLD